MNICSACNPMKEVVFSKHVLFLWSNHSNFLTLKAVEYPVDTGRKLNVHQTFRRRLLNVLCTFHLYPVSTGYTLFILIGDFNPSSENRHLDAVIQAYNLNNLIKKPKYFRSNNPSCIELILNNTKNLFKLSNTFETGLPDYHKLGSTILKSGSFTGTP